MIAQLLSGRLRSERRFEGFNLIELMIAMGIAALVASIAIPYFVTYRANAQAKACISNMRSIEYAKEQWALETKKNPADTPTYAQIFGPAAYIKNDVKCPTTDDLYVLGAVSERPTCPTSVSNAKHALP